MKNLLLLTLFLFVSASALGQTIWKNNFTTNTGPQFNGAGLTNVNAASLGGFGVGSFVQQATNGAQLATNWINLPVYLNKLQGGGGVIYLTNGIYVQTAPLYFTNQNTGPFQPTIIGQGMASTVILFQGFTNQDCIRVTGNSGANIGLNLSYCTIAGSVDSTNALIHFTHQDNSDISHCIFAYWPALTNAYLQGNFSGGTAGAPTHNSATNLIGIIADGNNGQLLWTEHNMFTMLHQGYNADTDHIRSIGDDVQGCGLDTSLHAELSAWPTNSIYYIPAGFVVGPDNYKDDQFQYGDGNGNYANFVFYGVTGSSVSSGVSVNYFNNENGIAFVASGLSAAVQFNNWGIDQINNQDVLFFTAGTTNFLAALNNENFANNSQICQAGYDVGAGYYILDAATIYAEGNVQFTGSLTGNAGSGLTGLSAPNLTGAVPVSSINGIGGITNKYVYGAVTSTNTFSYSVPAGVTNSYAIYGKVTVIALSLDVGQPKLVWTDETATVQTLSLGTSISGTGYYNLPYTTILAKGGTSIFVTNALTTATGSITYNVDAHLLGISSTQ